MASKFENTWNHYLNDSQTALFIYLYIFFDYFKYKLLVVLSELQLPQP